MISGATRGYIGKIGRFTVIPLYSAKGFCYRGFIFEKKEGEVWMVSQEGRIKIPIYESEIEKVLEIIKSGKRWIYNVLENVVEWKEEGSAVYAKVKTPKKSFTVKIEADEGGIRISNALYFNGIYSFTVDFFTKEIEENARISKNKREIEVEFDGWSIIAKK